MKNLSIYIICVLASLLASCDDIDRNDRLIYEKPASAKRAVLIEDFTGQRCVNCPTATNVIEQLLETYGDEALIVVGIHGGPLSFAGNATTLGLATDIGNEYYDHWGLQYQPVGLVDRHSPIDYPEWTSAIKEELTKPAPLSLKADAAVDSDGNISIHIEAYGTDGSTSGKLQVWLLEDGITALQMMPDGTANRNYVHNHVLRTPVNGTWGEDFSIGEGEIKSFEYIQQPDDAWDISQLSIVAFVYNDNGVQQATKVELKD